MDRLTEAFSARGGMASLNELKVQYPESSDEIDEFIGLVTEIAPVVSMLQSGLMAPGSNERAVLMKNRNDV